MFTQILWLTNSDKFAYVCSYAPFTATEEFKKNFGNCGHLMQDSIDTDKK